MWFLGSGLSRVRFFVAQDRQANGCLHTNSFAGRKDMEHEVRNVCVQNRVGVSLLDWANGDHFATRSQKFVHIQVDKNV